MLLNKFHAQSVRISFLVDGVAQGRRAVRGTRTLSGSRIEWDGRANDTVHRRADSVRVRVTMGWPRM